jgi:hypothetical protein
MLGALWCHMFNILSFDNGSGFDFYIDYDSGIMRSYLDKDTFFKSMKKKPAVQAVLDDIDNYTIENIEALTGSHFPRWIKDALIRIKEKSTRGDIEARVFSIAEQMNKYHERNKK